MVLIRIFILYPYNIHTVLCCVCSKLKETLWLLVISQRCAWPLAHRLCCSQCSLPPAVFFHRQEQWNYTCCIYCMCPYFLRSLSCNFKFTCNFKIYNKNVSFKWYYNYNNLPVTVRRNINSKCNIRKWELNLKNVYSVILKSKNQWKIQRDNQFGRKHPDASVEKCYMYSNNNTCTPLCLKRKLYTLVL